MSSIRTILVHVDMSVSSPARLLLAYELASSLGGDMTVLFGVTNAESTESHYTAAYDACALEADQRIALQERHQKALRARLGQEGPSVAWGYVPPGLLVEGFVREAAFADLVVLGQPERDRENMGLPPRSFLEAVALRGGRPTLIVPTALRDERIGRKVLVAWDGSAQAARALTAALPLLRHADSVDLLAFEPALNVGPFSHVCIDDYLQRHDIKASLRFERRPEDVGPALSAAASTNGVDLAVMGCYGHSRVREQLFGGATFHMLHTMPVPLLLAH